MPKYEFDINVNGASGRTGVDISGESETQFIPQDPTDRPTLRPQPITERDRPIGVLSAPTQIAGGLLTAGALTYRHEQTTAQLAGDTTKVRKMNELSRGASIAGNLIVGGLLTGNVVGALLGLIYGSYQISEENRALLNEQIIDQYQSNYYQDRLITNVSQRSR